MRAHSTPRWKHLVAIACVGYLLVAGVLPVLMIPFVNVLPFVHERGFAERLVWALAGTVLAVGTMVALDPRRMWQGQVSLAPRGSRWQAFTHWLGVLAGFALLTAGTAWTSPNLFGLATRVLPSEPYREVVVLESARQEGSGRRRSLALVLRAPGDASPRYLELSGRLFGDPDLEPGDVVELRGEAGPVGVYVTGVELQRRGLPAR